MSRQLMGLDKGFRIYIPNSDTYVDWLVGTADPVGTGDQASAPIGSIYQKIGENRLWQKKSNAGNPNDWILNSSDAPAFRKDIKVRAVTNQAITAGVTDPTAWADNESIDGTDFTVGEYIISDADGTPKLQRVDVTTSATSITVSDATPALSDNEGFMVQSYLPDSGASQEGAALVKYQNGTLIKLGDVNWEFANGINLNGFTPVNGTVTGADSVQTALEKIFGNQSDIQTTLGVAQGATHHGVMDQGDILSDNETSNTLFKETDKELTRQRGKDGGTNITTETTVGSVLVDSVVAAMWLVTVELASDKTKKESFTIFASHNGSDVADAALVDDTVANKLKINGGVSHTVLVDLNGTGAAQTMRLRISAGAAVNVFAKRIENLF